MGLWFYGFMGFGFRAGPCFLFVWSSLFPQFGG